MFYVCSSVGIQGILAKLLATWEDIITRDFPHTHKIFDRTIHGRKANFLVVNIKTACIYETQLPDQYLTRRLRKEDTQTFIPSAQLRPCLLTQANFRNK